MRTSLAHSLNVPPQYISEAVGAILDAPLRPRDVSAAVHVCSTLHQRYADVAPQLAPGLQRMLALSRQGAGTHVVSSGVFG